METVAFWRRLHPLLRVGGTSPDAHAEGVARLEPLAQAVTDARAVLRAAKRAELAAFAEIRALNLSVPLLIAGWFAKGGTRCGRPWVRCLPWCRGRMP